MGFFSRFKERAAAAVEAHFDAMHAKVLELPANTVWAAEAEWERARSDVEYKGVLFHDGHDVTFRSWHRDFTFTIPASVITHRRGEAKIDDGDMRGELEDVRPLRLVLPGYELPAFADIDEADRPMMGFFTSLGIPV